MVCKDGSASKINSILSRKKETEAAVVSGVANPSSTPALTVLNIFNTGKNCCLVNWKN